LGGLGGGGVGWGGGGGGGGFCIYVFYLERKLSINIKMQRLYTKKIQRLSTVYVVNSEINTRVKGNFFLSISHRLKLYFGTWGGTQNRGKLLHKSLEWNYRISGFVVGMSSMYIFSLGYTHAKGAWSPLICKPKLMQFQRLHTKNKRYT